MPSTPSRDEPAWLRPTSDVAVARAIVAAYRPACAAQAAEQARILEFFDAHPTDALRRECVPGHLTAGTVLVDAARERVLLHHHAKLDRWLQFGGHADGDANLRAVAWRETVEESGIAPAHLSEDPVDLDVHVIPARPAKGDRPAEPEHLHLDVRYLAVAPPAAVFTRSDESRALAWFSREEALGLGLDASVARLIALALKGARTGAR